MSKWLVLLLLLLLPLHLAAQKTDVVVLNNGDRMTGEVKELSFGKLRLKTGDAGTILIKWDKIIEVTAAALFEVEVESGQRYYGSLAVSPFNFRLKVINGTSAVDLFLWDIIRLAPIKKNFTERLEGSMNFGFSFTKASDVTRINLGGDVAYRTREYWANMKLGSITTIQPGKAASERDDLTVDFIRLLVERWLAGGQISLQRNTELGVDLRLLLGGGLGRILVQTNQNLLFFSTALLLNQEWIKGTHKSQSNLELPAGLEYHVFTFSSPETDVNARATVFPNLTTWGRLRLESDVTLSRKIVKNFTGNLTLYLSYDNKPPNATAAKTDYGVTVGFGLKL